MGHEAVSFLTALGSVGMTLALTGALVWLFCRRDLDSVKLRDF